MQQEVTSKSSYQVYAADRDNHNTTDITTSPLLAAQQTNTNYC